MPALIGNSTLLPYQMPHPHRGHESCLEFNCLDFFNYCDWLGANEIAVDVEQGGGGGLDGLIRDPAVPLDGALVSAVEFEEQVIVHSLADDAARTWRVR